VNDRALALAAEKAKAALAAARAGKGLAPVKLGSQTVAPEETGSFARGTPFVPKVGEAAGLVADTFATPPGQALPKVYETAAGPVVAVVKRRQSPDPKEFDAQREAIETRLRYRKESQVEGAWLRSLREDAKIVKNETLVASASSGAAQ
jgi:peptidyl-prolyl cis-trans isomerase D